MQHELPLRLVETIARVGSIRGAAEHMAITPSALNRRLLAIEDELGAQLFERVAQGVILNAAGEVFIAHARRQLAEMKAVRSKIEDLKGARRGRVVVAYDTAIKRAGVFSREIFQYQSAFPGVSFAVLPLHGEEISARLLDYQADLGLQVLPRKNSNLTSLAIAPARISVVAHADHPAFAQSALRLHDLVEYPWILAQNSALSTILQGAMQRQRLTYQTVFEADLSFAQQYLKESHTIGFEIDTATQDQNADGLHSRVLDQRDYPQLYVHLMQLRGRSLSVAAGRFAEQIRKNFAVLLENP